MAARVAHEALSQGDGSRRMLARYERDWQRGDGRELVYGQWLRRCLYRLSDRSLDRMLGWCDAPFWQARLAQLGDIDFASLLFMPLTGRLCQTPAGSENADGGQLLRLGV